MTALDALSHDRGLGSAYERYYFYRLLDRWAESVGAESLLEGPVDGMAGIPGVHGVGLARRGCSVVSVVANDAQAAVARGVYARAGARADVDVRVASPEAVDELPQADIVLAYHALGLVPDWRSYLERVAKRARKAVVVTVCNPENWGVEILRVVGALRGIRDFEPPEYWRTEILAPVLWELGRVSEHEFFDCPWWPDLQVSPGQSLLDRAKKLLSARRKRVQFTADGSDSELATRFVYGVDRWPYFGADGFGEELGPALARHPSFEHAARPKLRALAGHLHAFLVDVRPRTPQERRRLRLAREGEEAT